MLAKRKARRLERRSVHATVSVGGLHWRRLPSTEPVGVLPLPEIRLRKR